MFCFNQNVVFMACLLFPIHDVFCRIIIKRQAKNCGLVIMCPQFCLKVKNGCYICECGSSMKKYMTSAMMQMKHDYDPLYQTGSKFANMQMGGPAGTWPMSGTGKSPWEGQSGKPSGQYGNMMFGSLSANTGQAIHYLEPDFQEFYRPFTGIMPGSCPLIDYKCPLQCWTTEIRTGCLKCKCPENTQSTMTTTSSLLSTTPTPSTSVTVPFPLDSTTEPVPSTLSTELSTVDADITTEVSISGGRTTERDDVTSENTYSAEVTETTETMTSTVPENYTSEIPETTDQSVNTTAHFRTEITNSSSELPDLTTNPSSMYSFQITTTSSTTSKIPENNTNMTVSNVNGLQDVSGSSGRTAIQNLEENRKNSSYAEEYLLKLLINGMKNHDSLENLVQKLIADSQAATSDSKQTTKHSEPGNSTPAMDVKSMNQNQHSENCVDISDTCRQDCQLKDPLTGCTVCICSDEKSTTPETQIVCQPLDENCPVSCIALNDNMCPECLCTTENITSNDVTNSDQGELPNMTEDANNVCSPISTDCPHDCIKFDGRFCAICQCDHNGSSNMMRAATVQTTDHPRVCRPIDCTYSCLDFDENYCPICTCSKYPTDHDLIG